MRIIVNETFDDARFPSPCGDVVLKYALVPDSSIEYGEFPSPCGDVVLKLTVLPNGSVRRHVSVPLRGCGFKILIGFYRKGGVSNVSVPLRGCGFKMKTQLVETMLLNWFPSPCGDVVLK